MLFLRFVLRPRFYLVGSILVMHTAYAGDLPVAATPFNDPQRYLKCGVTPVDKALLSKLIGEASQFENFLVSALNHEEVSSLAKSKVLSTWRGGTNSSFLRNGPAVVVRVTDLQSIGDILLSLQTEGHRLIMSVEEGELLAGALDSFVEKNPERFSAFHTLRGRATRVDGIDGLLETMKSSPHVDTSYLQGLVRLGELKANLSEIQLEASAALVERVLDIPQKAHAMPLYLGWVAGIENPKVAARLTSKLLKCPAVPFPVVLEQWGRRADPLPPYLWEEFWRATGAASPYSLDRVAIQRSLSALKLPAEQHRELRRIAMESLTASPSNAGFLVQFLSASGAGTQEIEEVGWRLLGKFTLAQATSYKTALKAIYEALALIGYSEAQQHQWLRHQVGALARGAPSQEEKILCYEILREALPAQSAVLETAFAEHLLRYHRGDDRTRCEKLCWMVDQSAKWIKESMLEGSDFGNPSNNWRSAMHFTAASALARAGRFCPSAISPLSAAQGHDAPLSFEHLLADQTVFDWNTPARDAATIYARGFANDFFATYGAGYEIPASHSARLGSARAAVSEALSSELASAPLPVADRGTTFKSSIFSTYAFSALSLMSRELEPNTRAELLRLQQHAEAPTKDQRPEKVCRIPYSLHDLNAASPEDAAPRSLVVYLALFRSEPDATLAAKWLRKLSVCLDYFSKIAPILGAGHLGREGSHLSNLGTVGTFTSSRAPYYFLSVLPFAMDALGETADKTRSEQSTEWNATFERLNQSLDLVTSITGLSPMSGKQTSPSSLLYNNALSTLALTASCAFERKNYDYSFSRLTIPPKNGLSE